tara:strand:+ start:6 stop:1118 length:1113 start_codon:yes stop_codon:yes gene_type:complete
MISGHGNIETAVNSIKKGAYDFIEKPLDGDILIFKVTKALENYYLKNKINNIVKYKDHNYIAKSDSAKHVLSALKKITNTDSSVFLFGSHGSGKEFLARKIHFESNRKNRNFRVMDFSNSENFNLENQLFGNEEKNNQKAIGILDEVNGGTLLLKNIDKMSSKIQGKFLRILEDKKFYRIGGLASKKINLRFLGSSTLSINELRRKVLREDLLNKINFFEINIPNLNQRGEDLNDLVTEFIKETLLFYKMNIEIISFDIVPFFSNLSCITNAAQLKKFIEWSIFMFSQDNTKQITKESVVNLLKGFLKNYNNNENDSFLNFNLKDARETFEKKYLSYNLNKFNNNISKMSESIGMERTALYRKLKSLDIK